MKVEVVQRDDVQELGIERLKGEGSQKEGDAQQPLPPRQDQICAP